MVPMTQRRYSLSSSILMRVLMGKEGRVVGIDPSLYWLAEVDDHDLSEDETAEEWMDWYRKTLAGVLAEIAVVSTPSGKVWGTLRRPQPE
jgi:hypothetical protein